MREMMMTLGAEDPDSRKQLQPGNHSDNVPQNGGSNDRSQNNNRKSNDRILSSQSRCRQNNHQQHSNRIVEALWLKLTESAKRREREAWCRTRVVADEKSVMPEPCVLLEQEDITIPDAEDVVIEIKTDQMIDFDESSADALEIFAVAGGDKEAC